MKVFSEFKIQRDCSDCVHQTPSYFCNLSTETLLALRTISFTNTYAKGARLFIEGQPPEGVFMLCRGRVKLTAHSRDGKALILGIAVPGEVLGLSATVSNFVHEMTAEAIEPCLINFVGKSDFCRFLNQNADAGMNAVRQLSRQNNAAHAQIRSIGLSRCVADKLAKLILQWAKNPVSNNGSIHLKVTFSHEEIAEMIGTSRETVTRTLKDFRERGLIEIKGSDLYIKDEHALEQTIGTNRKSTPVFTEIKRIVNPNGFHR